MSGADEARTGTAETRVVLGAGTEHTVVGAESKYVERIEGTGAGTENTESVAGTEVKGLGTEEIEAEAG